jgi:hypothetical protein
MGATTRYKFIYPNFACQGTAVAYPTAAPKAEARRPDADPVSGFGAGSSSLHPVVGAL